MDQFTQEDFNELAVYSAFPAVSIYLATHKAGKEVNEGKDKLKLKNHLQDIAHQLDKDRHDRGFLEPAFDLLEDRQFWTNQDQGLALFLAPGIMKYYRMPYAFAERHVIAPSYYVSPMLRFCQKEHQFYLLALSMGEVRLFLGNKYAMRQLDLDPEVPKNIDEALWMDEPENKTHFQPKGKQPFNTTISTHGAGEADQKADIARYFKKVDKGIMKMIAGSNYPLLITAVDYLIPIYRETTEYTNCMPTGISGNPEHVPLEELHAKSVHLLGPVFEQEKTKAIDRFSNLTGSEIVSRDVKEIVPACHFSKVDVLFVSDRENVWGRFDEKSAGVELHKDCREGDEDLLNRAAIDTFLNGGRVFVLEKDFLPGDAEHAAAIYRYA